MLPFFKKNLSPCLLTLTALILCVINYTPGTYLSGWDTLHPEFNFSLNLERIIYGVFRTEQGLGAVAAHSHMGDLPRIIFLWIFDLFLPTSFLRYFYIFTTLIAGPIGMYFFLKRIVFGARGTRDTRGTFGTSEIPSFLGALFYMLNLGTLQQFVVPFEMFNALYATLPFLMLFATEYMLETNKNSSQKTLLYFAVATFLGTPMSYAATLWYVYFLLLCVYLGIFTLPHLLRKNFKALKRPIILILITLAINSFWLLPNFYFITNHSKEIETSYINTLFSPQAFLYNKEFGNINDLLLMKSFLFDWGIYANYNSYDKLLDPWLTHLALAPVVIIGYLLALVSLAGAIYTTFKKQKVGLALIAVTAVTLFFLINDNFPTGFIYNFIREEIPLFREALRFPHSKFYIHFIFVYAVFFAIGQDALIRQFKRLKNIPLKITHPVYAFLVSAVLIFMMLPAFQGQFIHPYIRIKIPKSYQDMSKWLNSQDDTRRIATLPINSFWGWEYYNWYGNKAQSFQGAGFLWFNIKQPLLVRDFDRWNSKNEGYYKEMSYAVYAEDADLLKNVLNKYQIGYIVLDTSNIAPEADPAVLFYDKIEKLLTQSGELGIEQTEKFGDNLTVYHFKKDNDYVYTISNPASIKPETRVQSRDSSFEKYGSYITGDENNSYFPFRNLIDTQNRLNVPYEIKQDGVQISLPKDYKGQEFELEKYVKSEELVPASLFVIREGRNLKIRLYPLTPSDAEIGTPIEANVPLPVDSDNYILSINQNHINFINNLEDNAPYGLGRVFLKTKSDNSIGLYKNVPDVQLSPDFSTLDFTLRQCNEIKKEDFFGISFLPGDKGFTLTGKNTPLCMLTPFTELLPGIENEPLDELLMGVNFAFENKKAVDTSRLPNMCIASITTGGCVNYIAKGISNVSLTSNYASFFGLRPGSVEDLGLKIFFDTTKSKDEQKVTYTQFDLSLSRPVFYLNFPPQILSDSLKSAFDGGLKTENLLIPFSGNTQLSQDITKLPKTTGLCQDTPLIEAGNKKKQIIEERENYIRYSSDEGNMCDYFSYQDLTQSQGHLLLITARNISGLPLTACATNYLSKKCDIFASLSKSEEFKTDVFVMPPISDTAKGYDININNLGIKGTPAINELKSIQIVPFPYKWITELEGATGVGTNRSEVQSVEYKQLTPVKYLARTESMDTNSVLVLSQTFEPGWKAYRIQNSELGIKNWLNRTFPWLFGEKLKEHVLVNNWSNGWVVDEQQATSNKQQVVIVFMPQYMEFFGFGLLFAVFGYLLYPYIRRHR